MSKLHRYWLVSNLHSSGCKRVMFVLEALKSWTQNVICMHTAAFCFVFKFHNSDELVLEVCSELNIEFVIKLNETLLFTNNHLLCSPLGLCYCFHWLTYSSFLISVYFFHLHRPLCNLLDLVWHPQTFPSLLHPTNKNRLEHTEAEWDLSIHTFQHREWTTASSVSVSPPFISVILGPTGYLRMDQTSDPIPTQRGSSYRKWFRHNVSLKDSLAVGKVWRTPRINLSMEEQHVKVINITEAWEFFTFPIENARGRLGHMVQE